MGIDPNNPVVKLCAAGIGAEMAGRHNEAAKLYADAWNAKTNDFEACIAAHYVARLQATPEDALRWNSEALSLGEAATDEDLSSFFPSLYLNLGKGYEDLGEFANAKRFYLLAEDKLSALPNDTYAGTVKRGIRNGLERVARAEKGTGRHA
jgi:tetratricopeptide (TPR) repeat protein